MRNAILLLCTAALPAIASAQSNQGWVLSMTMTSDSANGHAPTSMMMQFEFLGAKSRISIGGTAMAEQMGAMHIITDSAAGTMTNVMMNQKMAMIMDNDMVAMAKPNYSFEIVGTPAFKTEDLGAGQPVAGHPTHHYCTTGVSELKWTFGDETCSQKSKTVSEVWTTNEPGVDVPDLKAALARMGKDSRSPAAMRIDSLTTAGIKGRMLMQMTTVSTPTARGDSVTSHSRMQVNEMSKREIDPADFEVPADFHTMDVRQMMKGMDPSMLNQGAAMVTASMKKSICG